MQMQDKEATPIAASVWKSRGVSWLTSLLILLTLVASLGATVFAYSHTLHTSTTAPKATTWQRVLAGYSIISLTAAPSNPAILYACGTPFYPSTAVPSRPSQPLLTYTLLRSADSGITWQKVTQLGADCQLAINPTQSDDLYVVGLAGHIASNGEVLSVLRHSTDGGRSWTDIAPTLNTGNLSVVWHVQQLTMVGNHLFGIQSIPTARVHPIVEPSSVTVVTQLDLSRLVESSDGGDTWSIVDSNLNVTGQGTYGYVVSPSDPQTVYELVGSGWFPYGPPVLPGNMSTYGRNLTLYKTTNGGSSWTKLLDNIQYGSKIQLANSNPSLVYLGEPTTRVPLQEPVVSPLSGYFSLTVSKDGGTTWHTIKNPAEGSLVQDWFVSSDGHVYVATAATVGEQPRGATTGAVVPVGTTSTKPVGGIVHGNPDVIVGDVMTIQRYDVASSTWSMVTKTPSSGTLLTVTDSTTQHKTTLWFLSDTNGEQVLYKETL